METGVGVGKLDEEGEGGDGETATSGQNWEDEERIPS